MLIDAVVPASCSPDSRQVTPRQARELDALYARLLPLVALPAVPQRVEVGRLGEAASQGRTEPSSSNAGASQR